MRIHVVSDELGADEEEAVARYKQVCCAPLLALPLDGPSNRARGQRGVSVDDGPLAKRVGNDCAARAASAALEPGSSSTVRSAPEPVVHLSTGHCAGLEAMSAERQDGTRRTPSLHLGREAG